MPTPGSYIGSAHLGSPPAPSGDAGGTPPGRLPSPPRPAAGKPVLPLGVYTGNRGPPPLHIAFSAWSLPSVSPHNDFFCYINLTHCGRPRRWDPGLFNCVQGKGSALSSAARAAGWVSHGGCGGVGRGLGVVVGVCRMDASPPCVPSYGWAGLGWPLGVVERRWGGPGVPERLKPPWEGVLAAWGIPSWKCPCAPVLPGGAVGPLRVKCCVCLG